MTDIPETDTRTNGEIADCILKYGEDIDKTMAERETLTQRVAQLREERLAQLTKLKVRIGQDLIKVGDKVMKIDRNELKEVKVHG